MIRSLKISNYALIRDIEIDFVPGLNIITGETGAGKSIIMGALSMLLGARADMRVISDTARKSVVEAEFSTFGTLPGEISTMLSQAGAEPEDDGTCILRRELSPSGRSRAFVNDTPVNLATLGAIAMRLVDIHSQHQNLLLADPDFQLRVIDNLAGNEDMLREYQDAYSHYRLILKDYTETRDLIRRNMADADYIEYQLNELTAMEFEPGEQAELEREREVLANSAELGTKAIEAARALGFGEPSALDLVADAIDTLRDSEEADEDTQALLERLESLKIELNDIADAVQQKAIEYRADPERLQEVTERLGRIYSLELKHHADTVDQLIVIRDRLAEQLRTLADADTTLGRLEAEAKGAKRVAMGIARRLSESRAEAARKLASDLRERCAPLNMTNLRCEIVLTQGKLNPNGIDTADFMFAFNKNQALARVGDTASGGEISRVMLALKSILAEHIHLPSIIFDEIDTGVSGDVAHRMGALMAGIGERMQVITITHLPQVAAKGKAHFKVEKHDDEHSTSTAIRRLDLNGRRAELALMLSGDPNNITALAAADDLLANLPK